MRGHAFTSSNLRDHSSVQSLFILVRFKSFETKSVFGGMLRPRNIGRAEPDLRGLQKINMFLSLQHFCAHSLIR
jgi:hypothetical protein